LFEPGTEFEPVVKGRELRRFEPDRFEKELAIAPSEEFSVGGEGRGNSGGLHRHVLESQTRATEYRLIRLRFLNL
jgi:hypothetical protein